MIELALAAGNPITHVMQHTVWDLNPNGGPWTRLPVFSNHILMQLVAAALLIWLLPRAVRMRAGNDGVARLVPKGFGNAIEAVCLGLRKQIFEPNLGKHCDAFTPYLWSLFFFILTANVLGLIPLSDWFSFVPGHLIGGTSTANFWANAALALLTLALIVYNGLRVNGLDYVKHFFMGPWWIAPLIAFLEVIGLFFKSMALCVRLTANMLAGHILLAVLLGFCSAAFESSFGAGVGLSAIVIVVSILVYFLEILVAFLHAFIFTTLTAVFLGMALNIHHEEHHDEEHAEGAVAASH